MGIGGIGIGAISWWFFITYIISKLRKWFNIRGIGVMNRIVGFIIVALSILGAVSVIWPSFLNLPMLHIY
jgi:small neutral amino acid transporter SnatA (MarC family)